MINSAYISGRNEVKQVPTRDVLTRFGIEKNESTLLMAECLSMLSDESDFVYITEQEFNTIVHILKTLRASCYFDSIEELKENTSVCAFFNEIKALTTESNLIDRESAWVSVYKKTISAIEEIEVRSQWEDCLYTFVSNSLVCYFQVQLALYGNKKSFVYKM